MHPDDRRHDIRSRHFRRPLSRTRRGQIDELELASVYGFRVDYLCRAREQAEARLVEFGRRREAWRCLQLAPYLQIDPHTIDDEDAHDLRGIVVPRSLARAIRLLGPGWEDVPGTGDATEQKRAEAEIEAEIARLCRRKRMTRGKARAILLLTREELFDAGRPDRRMSEAWLAAEAAVIAEAACRRLPPDIGLDRLVLTYDAALRGDPAARAEIESFSRKCRWLDKGRETNTATMNARRDKIKPSVIELMTRRPSFRVSDIVEAIEKRGSIAGRGASRRNLRRDVTAILEEYAAKR
jgi:hypothetical protein